MNIVVCGFCGCGAEQEDPLKKALNGMLGLPHTTTPGIATSSSFAVLIAILGSLCWIIVLPCLLLDGYAPRSSQHKLCHS